MLSASEPIASTDLQALQEFLERVGRHRALPSALDVRLLLSLAMDLRSVEQDLRAEVEDQPCLAGPLAFLLHMMIDTEDQKGPQFSLPISTLGEAVQVFQFALEREIVSRILDKGSPSDDSNFIQALRELCGR